ncbi:maleylacetate reductase and hydroxyquinol 1,2-dioxygenase domain-containing protein [Amycolatopsis sp. NPDC059657]|uniref:maleylacetate reductase and hydroxyquinol 1,2-dioxygenase domain-containing protein n=1 Tax=Amycolatopsis sp. NPDC059657 TaxID=3346899 RepID=UPI00366D99E9
MTRVYEAARTRVLFGSGSLHRLRAEVELLGCDRVLVVGRRDSRHVEDLLGPLAVARFDGAVMHTPVEVTEKAAEVVLAQDIDCVVAVGGGTHIGLAKALARRARLTQLVVPTTYSGSEMTAVLGETANGVKRTVTDEKARPDTVIYDADLTVDLPVPVTVSSAINAMAHAVEALYAREVNPIASTLAIQAIELIARALPAVVAAPSDAEARGDLLRAAWFAGTCLGSAGMGLHHQLCHVLGGSFRLPHAETHAVLLPHVLACTAPSVPDVAARIAAALGAVDAATGVHDLVASVGGPGSLRELGLGEEQIPAVAKFAANDPYPHPVRPTEADLERLLESAWSGAAPPATAPSSTAGLTRQVVASFAGTPDRRTQRLLVGLVRSLHQYVVTHDITEREWDLAIDFLTRTGQTCDGSRQEFVLLSDVLGVSSMVDLLENSRSPDSTSSAVLGPFYLAGPPVRQLGDDIAAGLPGTPLWVQARVTDTAGTVVAGAVVDVWQSNEDGLYDVQLPDQDGPVLRGRFSTDTDGRLRFWSILPREYPIPDDGPVGELLSATGRHPYRAPHLHFLIQASGYRRLITQLFVRGGPYLDCPEGQGDAVFGVKDDLIVDFPEHDGSWRSLDFEFRIQPLTTDDEKAEYNDVQ